MATNSQSWDMSKIALESVLREHTPQYVILVMDLYNMTGEPYPKAQKAFLSAELQTSRWQDRPAELLRYMTSADRFTLAGRQLAHRLARHHPAEVERPDCPHCCARRGARPAGRGYRHRF